MTNAVMRRSTRNLDDEDEDINDFDPAYFPRKVYKDGRGPRVRLMLTDAAPRSRPTLYDASHHRPHYAVVDASDPHVRDAERAYYERNQWLQDAWRNPSGQMQQSPDNGSDNGDPDDDDDDGSPMSPRDEYIKRIGNAYKQTGVYTWAEPGPKMMGPQASPRVPYGNGGGVDPRAANAIEAQRRSWTRESGGGGRAPPGVAMGQHNPSAFPSRDAAALKDARADADQAHAEYVARISNAWRR